MFPLVLLIFSLLTTPAGLSDSLRNSRRKQAGRCAKLLSTHFCIQKAKLSFRNLPCTNWSHQLPFILPPSANPVRWKEAKGIHSNCKTTLVSVIDGARVSAFNTMVFTNTVFQCISKCWHWYIPLESNGQVSRDSHTVLSTVLYQEVCHLSIV